MENSEIRSSLLLRNVYYSRNPLFILVFSKNYSRMMINFLFITFNTFTMTTSVYHYNILICNCLIIRICIIAEKNAPFLFTSL